MYKAVFLDFYGTLVHEDDVYIEEICGRILKSSPIPSTTREVGAYWWNSFSKAFQASYGDQFQSQREIERQALQDTIAFYQSLENPDELCEVLFGHWQSPQLFEDTMLFLEAIRVPAIILSNIDRHDILAAIQHNGLSFEHVITSEDVRAYKPRGEMFQQALTVLNLNPDEVLHVGDSLTSDVRGANNAGIKVAWMNRKNKQLPPAHSPDYTVNSLETLLPLLS
ncbi:HAD family hydrolase [Paenibacillus sp. MMS18-CY102]|uniref:HAD family hydrolase n=1 Tax=Paenibacillus sp. MMS18-CY102 TaxID=2682849 RepID=UPI001365F285|nr:HAD family hydrolase [Paenibacillus sp. MMS18-CY102]MWC27655.1 HAD-IA family hydrolase [Paenibacillus sp. MMS18-CY102]